MPLILLSKQTLIYDQTILESFNKLKQKIFKYLILTKQEVNMDALHCLFGLFYFSISTYLGGTYRILLGKHHSEG